MKAKALSLALVFATLTTPLFTQPVRAEVEVSFDYFYDALAPFGEWIEVGDYGLCWRPTGVAEDWAPYTDGYWAYTDAGWTWVSYEDWGGITYHYGRWVHVRDEGWVWVPEYEWGPAWVSWRSSDDYVGWAPLPPEARWQPETGFSTWVDTSYDIGPDNYRFCHTQDFGSPFLAPVLLPCERNVTIIQNTVNITNISFHRGHSTGIFCGGPNFVAINRHCRRPIPALRLHCEDRAVRDEHGHAPPQVLRGNQLAVFAPKVQRPVNLAALPGKPRKVSGGDRINRGWGRVPEVAAQQKLRQKLGGQTAGLTPAIAPARPPKPVELSSLPRKADPNARVPGALGKVKPARNPGGLPGAAPVAPVAGQPIAPQRPRPIVDPRAQPNPAPPPVSVPQVAVPERSANPAPPIPARRSENPVRPPHANPGTAVDESARAAEKALRRQQREQQAAAQARENAQRSAELRPQPAQPPPPQIQRPDPARQQQREAAQRANEMRHQQAQQQQARQNQEAAQRANDARDQLRQQRQQMRQAEGARQSQVAAQQQQQRVNELRQQQMQQQAQAQAQQFSQQQAAQRAQEMRQQQMLQSRQLAPQREAARRPQPLPAPPQPSAPAAPAKNGHGEKKKHRER